MICKGKLCIKPDTKFLTSSEYITLGGWESKFIRLIDNKFSFVFFFFNFSIIVDIHSWTSWKEFNFLKTKAAFLWDIWANLSLSYVNFLHLKNQHLHPHINPPPPPPQTHTHTQHSMVPIYSPEKILNAKVTTAMRNTKPKSHQISTSYTLWLLRYGLDMILNIKVTLARPKVKLEECFC